MNTDQESAPAPAPAPEPAPEPESEHPIAIARLEHLPSSNVVLQQSVRASLAPSPIGAITTVAVTAQTTPFDYKEVDKLMNDSYNFKHSNSSTICDIMAMYLKGQKILYTESKTVCEQRLNYLMLPAIFVTSICTILSLVIKDYAYGPTIVSSLNGFNVFLLALINYLKLDAKAEAHRTAAYKFDKLQSYMEFNSGRMLFDTTAADKLAGIIEKTENDVREIKETNQFILPEIIRYGYPRLYSINVFSEVKKIQNSEMYYINSLKNLLNEEDEILATAEPNRARLAAIKSEKEQNTVAYIKMKDRYLEIDKVFEEEMSRHRSRITRRCELCAWLKT
jgi:hypothetical protein